MTQPAKCINCSAKKVRFAYQVLCQDCVDSTGHCAKVRTKLHKNYEDHLVWGFGLKEIVLSVCNRVAQSYTESCVLTIFLELVMYVISDC